jgi:murein DD-endopeptidase MepM/ murein hydrolase activator NlpD
MVVAGIVLCACRTGRTSAPTRAIAGAPTKKGVTHVVQRGQTLYRISKTYGVSVEQLTKVNRLSSAADLATGARLWIPGAARVLEVPATAATDSTPAEAAKPTPTPKPVAEKKPAPTSTPKPVAEKAKPVAEVEKSKPSPSPAKPSPEPPKSSPEPVAAKEKPQKEKPPVEKSNPPLSEDLEGADEAQPEAPPDEKPAKPAKEKSSGDSKQAQFVWPVKGFVQSPFGQRGSRPHDGVDIKADKGSTIVAVANGEVIYSGVQRGYGNIVLIKHADDLITIYAHNETNDVKQGERVLKGQAIATVGRTGRATNDHLHFEVRQNRIPKDPLLFLPEE